MTAIILLIINFLLNVNSFIIKFNNKNLLMKRNSKLFNNNLFYFECDKKNNDECIKIINSKNKELNETDNSIHNKNIFYRFGTFPRLDYPNKNGQLTWYPIGFSNEFSNIPKKVTIRDINYVVWKDSTSYYGLRDCCSHQGSSFIGGKTFKNTISSASVSSSFF